jgi:hypothetical protein
LLLYLRCAGKYTHPQVEQLLQSPVFHMLLHLADVS